jgi:hypothetical protein
MVHIESETDGSVSASLAGGSFLVLSEEQLLRSFIRVLSKAEYLLRAIVVLQHLQL